MDTSLIPLILFAMAMTGTPGPGNLAMMAIGQTSGYRSALPFLLGTFCGFVTLGLALGYGLAGLFATLPVLHTALQVVGTLYILYLAAKVLGIKAVVGTRNRAFTFREGVFLHPLNPKSWAMLAVAHSQFAPQAMARSGQIFTVTLIFALGLLIFHSLWCLGGSTVHQFVSSRRVLTVVNGSMAALMVGATTFALFI